MQYLQKLKGIFLLLWVIEPCLWVGLYKDIVLFTDDLKNERCIIAIIVPVWVGRVLACLHTRVVAFILNLSKSLIKYAPRNVLGLIYLVCWHTKGYGLNYMSVMPYIRPYLPVSPWLAESFHFWHWT